ncbi:DNA cytosine methyltransferase [Candidatus Dependentiae bacterium]|nr:MAG: DNA cytosine methyltransferase [Candidatus Dependentiae bacterium]
MKVLELFCGSGSIRKAANIVGGGSIQVFSSDIEQFGYTDYMVDILKFDYKKIPFEPDVIWSSPPCTGFSVAAIGRNWNKDKTPKTETAKLGLKLVQKTIDIIDYFAPKYYFIENPRGMLRKLDIMDNENLPDAVRHTVTYCQYGEDRMKPTDIWTNNKNWKPKRICSNGDICHESAPRGSRTGTQGQDNAFERSKLPEELCVEILKSCI